MTLSVGKILMQERRARKLQLQAISRELCISKSYLQALENEDWDSLPPRVFAIGFLRTYADYLELDAEELIEATRECSFVQETTVDLHLPDKVHESRMPAGGVMIAATTALISVVFGWSVLSASSDGDKNSSAVPDRFFTQEGVSAVKENPDEAKSTQASFSSMFPSFKTGKAAAQIEIQVKRDVWVMISDENNRILRDGIVRMGEIINIPAKSNLRLTSSDAGALVLHHGGRVKGPMGQTGDVLNAYSMADLD